MFLADYNTNSKFTLCTGWPVLFIDFSKEHPVPLDIEGMLDHDGTRINSLCLNIFCQFFKINLNSKF